MIAVVHCVKLNLLLYSVTLGMLVHGLYLQIKQSKAIVVRMYMCTTSHGQQPEPRYVVFTYTGIQPLDRYLGDWCRNR